MSGPPPPGADEHHLGPVDQVPLGEGRLFEVAGRQVAVFRPRAGGVHAVDPVCPHSGGPLADGMVGGTLVVCPLHGWAFDLTSGGRVGGPESVACHQVREEGGQIILSRMPVAAGQGGDP